MIIDTNSGAMNVASELNVWLTVRRVAAVSGGPEYQHVRIQRHLKQHDADGHEKHAAEETVEAGLDAEIIQRHAEPGHDYARDQRRLVSDLAQQPMRSESTGYTLRRKPC